jgi:8-oxo-dGTP pyrophosphatase MutT (NUDIX family)
MRWTVHGRRQIYTSPWVELWLDDVEIPGGERFEHRVVRMRPTVTALVFDDAAEHVLLLWRHRFITDAWGWEVPGGWIDSHEAPAEAIAREIEEETGWRPGPMTEVGSWFNMPGISDAHCTLYRAEGATLVGSPVDASESTRIGWVSVGDISKLVADRRITDADTLIALSFAPTAPAPRTARA